MTELAMNLFGVTQLLGVAGTNGFGLWMFLSIGAVAMFGIFIPVTAWIEGQRKEREAFYRAETVRRLTESSGEGAKAAIELLREQDRIERAKKHEGMKIGGLVNIGVGLALIVFLKMMVPYQAAYLCGLIPGFIGVALLVYVFFMAKPVV
jgi:hypothetical protein